MPDHPVVDALILVDLQNDFMPGGALAVADGDAAVAAANDLMPRFDVVIATQDWHPANHGSFVTEHPGKSVGDITTLGGLDQVVWPVHCVQDTPGAALHPALDKNRIAQVVTKGTDPSIDSYSGFFDNGHRQATALEPELRSRGVTRVFIMGLATDYCVQFTARDAVRLGFETFVIEDACRGVEHTPGDVARAKHQMAGTGVTLIPMAGLPAHREHR